MCIVLERKLPHPQARCKRRESSLVGSLIVAAACAALPATHAVPCGYPSPLWDSTACIANKVNQKTWMTDVGSLAQITMIYNETTCLTI